MKKIIIFLFVFLFLALISAYSLAFTSFGNSLLEPYAQSIIKNKTGFDIKFVKFQIRPTNIDIEAIANSEINAKIRGTLSIFSKKLDINYDVEIENLLSMGVNLKEKMSFAGLFKGNFQDFNATGVGILLGSNVKFNAKIKDKNLLALILDAQNLELDKALALTNQPPYANGKISLTANIAPQNDKPNGFATIELNKIQINNKLIQQNFGVQFPANFNADAKINAEIKDSIINAKSVLISTLFTLGSQKTIYDINSKTLSSDFKIIIDDLSNLEPIINKKLKGSLKAESNIIVNKNEIKNFDTLITAFGGNIKAALNANKLIAKIEDIKIEKILKSLELQEIAQGALNGDIRLDNLDPKNLSGVAKFTTSNGVINQEQMSKISGKNVPNGLKFGLNSQTEIKNNVANFSILADILSANGKNLLNAKDINGMFDINANKLKSDFVIDINDLKSLSFLTGQNFNGELKIVGDLNKDEQNLNINANAKLFNGNLTAELKNDDLNIDLNAFTAKGLSDFLGFSHVYDGVGDMKMSYNLAKQSGKFGITINQGQLVKTQFSQMVANFTGKDLTQEIYKNGEINGVINQNLINFNANMKADKSNINITNGEFNTNTKDINIPIKLNYEKTDIDLTMTGTSENPKYSISSEYLKNKVAKEVDKFLGKKLGTDNNSKKDAIKGLLKNLF